MPSFEFTKETPRENSWLVYFNGIEVPTISIDVRMGVWMIPTADIALPPDKELYRLGAEDRVQVAAFYLDNYHTEVTGRVPDFRLLFEGDIVGWQFTNTPAGRVLRFRAANYLDILDSLYTFFMSGVDTLAQAGLEKKVDPALNDLFAAGPIFPAALLISGLDPTEGKMIRRPFDLLENAIRACIDGRAHERFASVPAVNFYARYMNRSRMNQRFVPSPLLEIDHMRISDEQDMDGVFPMLRYTQFHDIMLTLGKRMSEIGNNTIWNILRDTFMRMYYEIMAITTAPIANVSILPTNKPMKPGKAGVRGEIVGPPVFGKKPGGLVLTENRILNYVTKPDWKFGIPPTCNVIFPSMITQFVLEEDYSAQATRMHLNDGSVEDVLNNPKSEISRFVTTGVAYPVRAQEELEQRESATGGQGNMNISGKNFLVWPEEFFRGPMVIQEPMPTWFIYLLNSTLRPTRYEQVKPTIDDTTFQREVLKWNVPKTDGKLKEGAVDKLEEKINATYANRDAVQNDQTKADTVAIKFSWLKRLYARYEYYRQRSSCKSGVVTTIFNPYIVPGFPVFIFDDLGVGNHCVGYATEVTHSINQRQSSTTVTLTQVQTLDEYMNGIRESQTGENPEERLYTVMANPPHPIPDVRIITQMLDMANQYFRELFHRDQTYSDPLKTAAFDFTKAIELVLPGCVIKDVKEHFTSKKTGDVFQKYTDVQPSTKFKPMFENASNAMALISRPICTLEEYIDFFAASKRGVRGTKIEANDARQGKGAVYYEKILKFEQGPGPTPAVNADNTLVNPVTADTRQDWETRLQNYRKKVIFQLHTQEE